VDIPYNITAIAVQPNEICILSIFFVDEINKMNTPKAPEIPVTIMGMTESNAIINWFPG
jgi:hypothetical protein